MNSKTKRDIAEQMVAALEAGAPITKTAAEWLLNLELDGSDPLVRRIVEALLSSSSIKGEDIQGPVVEAWAAAMKANTKKHLGL